MLVAKDEILIAKDEENNYLKSKIVLTINYYYYNKIILFKNIKNK